MPTPPIDLNQLPVLISAVGAFGAAAMGVVEALGKALLVFDPIWAKRKGVPLGLPYAGYGKVGRLLQAVGPAMRVTYGEHYHELIAGQYRAGRGASQAPDMIRQGVRLGLPYLSRAEATTVLKAVWGMPEDKTDAFAGAITALTAPAAAAPVPGAPAPAAPALPPAAGLAGRFATALDSSVQAVFDSAEQVYQTQARFWAAVAAVGLALLFYENYPEALTGTAKPNAMGWIFATIIGLAAVPLAPVFKDLSTSLSQALTALGQAKIKLGS